MADQDRSREFYRSLLGGQLLVERDQVIIKVANMWLTLTIDGGPTTTSRASASALRRTRPQ